MIGSGFWRFTARAAALAALGSLAAGCIPRGQRPVVGPTPTPTEEPDYSTLPADAQRHRVALLVPMTGSNAAVGQSLANATTMALLDTNAKNLRITTYDTGTGPQSAAARAIADGNRLILGPLLGEDVGAVVGVARPARVPVISFSNDDSIAGTGVYLMGQMPEQSIARAVDYARHRGITRFAALVPAGEYGKRAEAALSAAVRREGGTLVASETFNRANTSITSAARRLNTRGGFDAVLIADASRIAITAAPLLKAGNADLRVIGTELWSGESAVAKSAALRGSWFAATSDTRFRQFTTSYRKRFGSAPHRIATLGYDSVLLTLNVARNWKPGTTFPTGKLADKGGFLGLDGAFRFGPNGVAERALEVREATTAGIIVVSPAPARFGD